MPSYPKINSDYVGGFIMGGASGFLEGALGGIATEILRKCIS